MSKLPKSDLDCYWSATAAQNLLARKPSAPYKISPLSRQQEWPAGSRAKWRNVVFPYVLWPFPSPRLGTRLRNKDSESDFEISCVGWDERAKGTMCVWVSSEYPSLHCRAWGPLLMTINGEEGRESVRLPTIRMQHCRLQRSGPWSVLNESKIRHDKWAWY